MTPNFSATQVSRQESLSWHSVACADGLLINSAMTKGGLTQEERDERRAERLEHQRKLLEFIPLWLEKEGLNQRTLAEHLKVPETSVSKWINGTDQMPTGVLRQIAVILKAHQGDLLRPPEEAGLGERVEETLEVMDDLDEADWRRVMEVAKAIRDAKKR